MKAHLSIASAMVLSGTLLTVALCGGCAPDGESTPKPSASENSVTEVGSTTSAERSAENVETKGSMSSKSESGVSDHDHSGHDHSDHDHSDHDHSNHDHSNHDHSGHDASAHSYADGVANADGSGSSDGVVSTERPSREEALSSRFVNLMEVVPAPVDVDLGESRFAGQQGFEAPDDPEAEFIRKHGRRESPWIDGELSRGIPGFDSFVAAIMEQLREGDAKGLMELQIAGADYKRYCWPEFPQSRPITKIPVDESWFFLERKAYSGVQRGVQDFGGQTLTPTRVYFREGRVDYENFTLFKGMVIAAQGPQGGAETLIDFIPVVIERNGRWNVYTYED